MLWIIVNATNKLLWALYGIWKRPPSLRNTPLVRFAYIDWSINDNRKPDTSHLIYRINLVVTGVFVLQFVGNLGLQIELENHKMRCSTAAVLASAIHIVTAAWHRNVEDKQYTIEATNIKAKVSCFAKDYKGLLTSKRAKNPFSLSLTVPRLPICGSKTNVGMISTSSLVMMT